MIYPLPSCENGAAVLFIINERLKNMQNTELTKFENTDVSIIDFDSFREYLENALEKYRNNVYTPENLAVAKNDKAELNKVKKMIDDKRKEYKAKCLAPYEAVEYRFRELISMIDEQRNHIDSSIKIIDDKNKSDRETDLRKYYVAKSAPLGQYADRMYKRIFCDRWLKNTYSLKKCEEEILVAIKASVNDLETLKKVRSPFFDDLTEHYLNGGSVESCLELNEKLINAAQKAGAEVNGNSSKAVVTQEITDKAGSDNGVTVKISGTKDQLEQVFDFMKIIGIKFEIQ